MFVLRRWQPGKKVFLILVRELGFEVIDAGWFENCKIVEPYANGMDPFSARAV